MPSKKRMVSITQSSFDRLLREGKVLKEALERIRDWEYTSKGSCDILRGFARKALKEL